MDINKIEKQTFRNNGLMTKIWGPHMWFAIHSIAFGYPIEPTDEQKNHYRVFFENLGNVLPCMLCNVSYNKFIIDMNDSVFENRDSLTKWTFELHNKVNQKLNINYNTSYEELCEKFESFRAKCNIKSDKGGCNMSLELKSIAFQNADIKVLPLIPLNLAKWFVSYAAKRGINLDKLEYYDELLRNKTNNSEIIARNMDCYNIIKNMRYNVISSLELDPDSEFKDLPSIEELQLISMLSTSMSEKELIECASKLGYKKKYKLIK
jgi:hypothetical protein